MIRQLASLTALSLFLTGCASLGNVTPLPQEIIAAPENDIQYSETIGNIDKYTGGIVRWGGRILKIERDETQNKAIITVIEQMIKDNGRPDYALSDDKRKHGRFMVEIEGDLTEKKYPRNNFITVYGSIKGKQSLPITNKNNVDIPVISAKNAMLWPSARQYSHLRSFHSNIYYDNFYYSSYRYGFGFRSNPYHFRCNHSGFSHPYFW